MTDEIILLKNLVETLQEENENLKKLLQQHNIFYSPPIMNAEKKNENKTQCNSQDQILTPEEKIRLYRSFFRGRDDVYALRWENTKTNRSGYSPACENEWRPKVCGKPKIKCNACPNQKWRSITDQVMYAHLTGECFIGIYPLLQNDHCYFLAIDFDKEQWQVDVIAFAKICDEYKVPYLVERSQSGNGAHIWIFFEEAIPAVTARNLGTALLTLTMQQHPHLSMDSYDRLFPNQDTLPKGGFGNLIALPLQGKRRTQGNSSFINIDNDFIPYHDPWKMLEKTKKLSLEDTQFILDKVQKLTGILDIEYISTEEDPILPWEHRSKTVDNYPVISESIPSIIEIVKADLLYISIQYLPTKLINSLRKIAAFQNPEFYRAQAMRLSTFGKPRVIHCAELFSKYIGLPRGCKEKLLDLLSHYNIKATMIDKREEGKDIEVTFSGELLESQKKSIDALLQHDIGVLSATTGFGKTVVAASMIASRKTNTLILVHRQQLLEQWQERLMTFLGLEKKQIGVVKSGKFKLTNSIDIAMMQSLVKEGKVADEVSQYGHVIVDECHHLSAFSFEQLLKRVKAKYVLGLTATPYRKDGHHPIIFMQCGPIRFQTTTKIESDFEKLTLAVYIRQTAFKQIEENNHISQLYQQLVEDQVRNQFILQDLIKVFNAGHNPLLLTERTQHLDWFTEQLNVAGVNEIYVLKGGMRKKSREEVIKKLNENQTNRILLATGRYIGEGFDDPKLDILFLALPISWHGTLQQYVGRLHRLHHQKQAIKVYDYVDSHSPVLLRMYKKRVKKYKAMGYSVCEVDN